MSKNTIINIYCLILTICLFLIDFFSKQIMLIQSNGNRNYSVKIFGNFLRLSYVENHGGVFGIFQGHIAIFTILSTILIIYIIVTEIKKFSTYSIPVRIAISFIAAGALGNMYDRIFRGYVIDMIDFRGVWKFVFNLADVYIHIGIYILIGVYIYKQIKEKK